MEQVLTNINININNLLIKLLDLYKNKFILDNNINNFNTFYLGVAETISNLKISKHIIPSNINFLKTIEKLLTNLVKNQGYLTINPADFKQFAVGENLAITPGKVIFKNSLIELICYTPVTPKVYTYPILFVPPCINKYYILDLSQDNSLVKWLIHQGFVVYMISWVNPSSAHKNLKITDYILKGIVKSIDIINIQHKHQYLHVAGYCIGGTLLNCALSYLQHHNNQNINITSVTNFMTLLDFSNLNISGNFINKSIIKCLNNLMLQEGYLDGRLLNMLFNTLRPKDLILPYIINHYILDQPIKENDFMYWNADPCNLPIKMYDFYLKNFCLKNKLTIPNSLKLNNVSIDLKNIHLPIFSVAGQNDHIANWSSIYNSLKLYRSHANSEFILANSGHIKGLINPPNNNKNSFYTNKNSAKDPDLWLKNSTKHNGSWWKHWINWLTNINKEQVSSKIIYQFINNHNLEDAPGQYIHQKLTN